MSAIWTWLEGTLAEQIVVNYYTGLVFLKYNETVTNYELVQCDFSKGSVKYV